MTTRTKHEMDRRLSDVRNPRGRLAWPTRSAGLVARVLISVAAALAYLSLGWIVPDALQPLVVGSIAPTTGRALFILLAAFEVIELVALAAPGLRWRRVSGPRGRITLNRASVALAVVVALLWPTVGTLFQSMGLGVATASSMSAATLFTPSRLAAAMLHALLVALLVALGAIVSRFGIGNGISLFIGLEAVTAIAGHVAHGMTGAPPGQAFHHGAILGLGVLGVGVLLWTTLRWSARRFGAGTVLGSPTSGLLCPTAGVVALHFASVAAMLPATLANLGVAHSTVWARTSAPGSIGFVLLRAAGTLIGAMAFSWLFYRPTLLARLSRPEPSGDAAGAAASFNQPFRLALAVTLTFYAACLVLDQQVDAITGVGLPLVAALLTSAIAADVWLEWRARAAGPLLKVWELHQPYAHALARETLQTSAQRFHLRAANHRALGLFFAPYVPVEVFVDEASAAQSAQALAQRLLPPAAPRGPDGST